MGNVRIWILTVRLILSNRLAVRVTQDIFLRLVGVFPIPMMRIHFVEQEILQMDYA